MSSINMNRYQLRTVITISAGNNKHIGAMKNYKETITTLLTAAVLLIAVFMTGCTKLSEAPNNTPSEVDTSAESDGFGVYVKLERDDVSSVSLHGGSFIKVCENADGVTCSTSDAADAPAGVRKWRLLGAALR